jgi:2-polyprenyl-3-methyl-5-hydroxy-6-metoxy-1,4-benzoquinol methylase
VTAPHLEPSRTARERAHGARLSTGDPDDLWGWGSAAGRLRAQRRARLLVAGAGLQRGSRVLEVGCGTGLFTAHFASVGVDLTAIDVSAELLDRAQARSLSGVRFVLGDVLTTDIGGPFDAVIGSSVLHHLPMPEALNCMHGLLKTGGRLAFAEPNFLNPQIALERTLRFLPYYARYTSPDETAFVRWHLARALRRSGFTNVTIVPHDWLHPATPGSMIERVRQWGRRLEQWPVIREFAGSLLISATRS